MVKMDSDFDVSELRKIIGKKVKLLRKAKKYTQVGLGEALGYTSTGTISQIETGARGFPLPSMMKLAKILDVHPAVLISPVETTDPDDLITLSKVIYLIEMKRDGSKDAGSMLGAIKALFELLPVSNWSSFKHRAESV